MLVAWRCCGLSPKTDFSGGREGAESGGPAPLEDERVRGSQPGRGWGQSPLPHSPEQLGPWNLQDPDCPHLGEHGLDLGQCLQERICGVPRSIKVT